MHRGSLAVAVGLLGLAVVVSSSLAEVCFDYGSVNPVVTMFDPGYQSQEFVLDGNLAYVAQDYPWGLSILDISDPAHPQEIASLPDLDNTDHLCREGDLLYAAGYAHLTIIDASEPTAPAILGKLALEQVYDLAVVDALVYLAAYDRFIVVDATEPAHPVIVGEITLAGDGISRVAISGTYAYVATYSGIYVVDIGNPAAPQWLSRFWSVSDICQVEVQDGRLWILRYRGTTLTAFDLDNPAAPQWRGSWNGPEYCYHCAIADGRALLCNSIGGLHVVDIAEPETIHETNYLPNLTNPSRVAFWGDLAIVGLYPWVYAVVDPRVVYAPPTPVFSFHDANAHFFLRAANGRLYGTYRSPSELEHGLQIFNIDTAGCPEVVGMSAFPHGNYPGDFEVVGDLAYVPLDGDGLRIIDVSNPQAPVVLSTLDVPSCAVDVSVRGSWVYIAIDGFAVTDGKVVYVDAHDPAAPSIAATVQLPYRVDSVAVMDDIVVAGTEDGRLFTLTSSVPPTILGSIDLDQSLANDIVVSGSIAFAAGHYGVRAVDCSDPAAPIIVDSWHSGDNVHQLAIAGDDLYASTDQQGVAIFDVASDRLQLVGYTPPLTFEYTHGFAVGGGLVYTSHYDGLIQAFPAQCGGRQLASPTAVSDDAGPARLVAASGAAPVSMRLQLPAAQNVDVAVFDLRGRRVASLAAGLLPAGDQALTWNGRDRTGRVCAAGVYVVRLAAQTGATSRSFALLH